jgi:hypothetical protein
MRADGRGRLGLAGGRAGTAGPAPGCRFVGGWAWPGGSAGPAARHARARRGPCRRGLSRAGGRTTDFWSSITGNHPAPGDFHSYTYGIHSPATENHSTVSDFQTTVHGNHSTASDFYSPASEFQTTMHGCYSCASENHSAMTDGWSRLTEIRAFVPKNRTPASDGHSSMDEFADRGASNHSTMTAARRRVFDRQQSAAGHRPARVAITCA